MISIEPWYVISMRTPSLSAKVSKIGSSSAFSEPDKMRSTSRPLPKTVSACVSPPQPANSVKIIQTAKNSAAMRLKRFINKCLLFPESIRLPV